MSDIFNPNGTTNSDGNPTQIDLDSITLETLVGEGRKYADPNQLAKGYANADAHIARLEKEKIEFKVKADLLEAQLNTKTSNVNNEVANPPATAEIVKAPSDVTNDFKNVDISELVAKELGKITEQKSFADNVNSAAEKLTDIYGSPEQANSAVIKRAKELGVSTDWLMDAAGKSPAAFYATMGIANNSGTPNISGSGYSPERNTLSVGGSRGNQKNFVYYENIRKTNPNLYHSRATQSEMFTARKAQGDNFYNN